MTVVAPAPPGHYSIHLSMVHEGAAWWEDKGWGGDIVQLVIKRSMLAPSAWSIE